MTVLNLLLSMTVIAASGLPAAAVAEPQCILLDFSRVPTLCTGQPSTLNMTVMNACSTPQRVSLAFAIDKETIREKTAVEIAPLETLAQRVLMPLPSTVRPGRHTLTVSVKGAAGSVSTTELDLTVDACDALEAGVVARRVGPSSTPKE